MTNAQFKENLEDGLTNLKRHYEICCEGYDRAALKGLAHTLRIWMDMKKEVGFYLNVNRPTSKFTSFALTRQFSRDTQDCEYAISSFPGGVTVKIISEVDGSLNLYTGPKRTPEMTTTSVMIRHDDSRFTVKSFGVLTKSLPEARMASLQASKSDEWYEYRKVKFGPWLDSIALRTKFENAEGIIQTMDISRETLVRRVANAFGASHPEGGYEMDDEHDIILKNLMKYKLLDQPLPYIILLKMAHDILKEFGAISA